MRQGSSDESFLHQGSSDQSCSLCQGCLLTRAPCASQGSSDESSFCQGCLLMRASCVKGLPMRASCVKGLLMRASSGLQGTLTRAPCVKAGSCFRRELLASTQGLQIRPPSHVDDSTFFQRDLLTSSLHLPPTNPTMRFAMTSLHNGDLLTFSETPSVQLFV